MQKDILIKKNQLWLSESYLIGALKGVNEVYLRKVRSDKSYKGWIHNRINGKIYYDYDSIPDKSPNCYKSQLPDYEILRGLSKTQKVAIADEDEVKNIVEAALNRDYVPFMRHYTETPLQQKGLAQAAAIIDGITRWLMDNDIPKKNQLSFLEVCERVLKGYKTERFYLPTNNRRLQDKVNELIQLYSGNNQSDNEDESGEKYVTILGEGPIRRADISDIIYAPRMGNINKQKFDDAEVKAWIMLLRGSGLNVTNALITRKIRFLCEVNGKGVPSQSWFSEILAKHETKIITASKRWGDGINLRRYKGYIPHQRPCFAGDCWQMDGTRFNTIAWKVKNEHTGKWVEKYLMLICIRDVYSGYVLGWSFGLSEDRWMYAQALKMAYERAGHFPNELVSDKFPGHNTEQWIDTRKRLEKSGVKCTITSEASGKAQLERWIGTLQTVFEAESLYYYGEGIRSKRPYAHRHPAYMDRLRKRAQKDGWDAAKSIQEAEVIVERYNATPINYYSKKYRNVAESPQQLYEQSEKPHVVLVPKQAAYLACCELKEMQIYGDQITTTIDGEEYHYAVSDAAVWLKYPKILMSYDPQDLNTIWLFDPKTEKYLSEATTIEKVQRYGAGANMEAHGKRKAQLKANEALKNELFDILIEPAQGVNEETLLRVGRIQKDLSEAAETQFYELPEALPMDTVEPTKKVEDESDDFDPRTWGRSQY
jgi:hypothetical protein